MIKKIKEKWLILENFFIKNNVMIAFVFISFLKPLSLYYFEAINNAYNIWMATTGLIICIIYFRRYILKTKLSEIQQSILIFTFIMLISTILGTRNFSTYIKTYLKWLSISFYVEMLIKENLDGLLRNLGNVIFSYIIINTISVIIFPNGIVNPDGLTPVFFLGNDNTTTLTLVLGTLFNMLKSYFYYKRLDMMSILAIILVTGLYIRNWSVTALISMLILLFYVVFLYKRKKKQKKFN